MAGAGLLDSHAPAKCLTQNVKSTQGLLPRATPAGSKPNTAPRHQSNVSPFVPAQPLKPMDLSLSYLSAREAFLGASHARDVCSWCGISLTMPENMTTKSRSATCIIHMLGAGKATPQQRLKLKIMV